MSYKKKIVISFLLILILFSEEILACTGIRLKAEDGGVVSGRTVEFGSDIEMSIAVIPRHYRFVGNVPKGKGMPYQSKYAAIGIYCFDEQVLMDGINEKGLVAAAFYFPGYAEYANITQANISQALSPVEFPNWILTQFATIAEVKAALKSVVIAPTIIQSWGETPPPMHYIVYDAAGESLVIEPLNGTLVLYDNPIGVFTNSPAFDWHLTNLCNYINLSVYNVDSILLQGLELAPFGQGSGLVGLPGDFTPPSRFIRAAIFSTSSISIKRAEEAVSQAFHILNQFDIPAGAVREKEKTGFSYDSTLLTSVKDPSSLRYYYRSYNDQAIRYIDLNQFDPNSTSIHHRKVNGSQKALDVSALLIAE